MYRKLRRFDPRPKHEALVVLHLIALKGCASSSSLIFLIVEAVLIHCCRFKSEGRHEAFIVLEKLVQ